MGESALTGTKQLARERARPAVLGEATAGHHVMDMRVVLESPAPSMPTPGNLRRSVPMKR